MRKNTKLKKIVASISAFTMLGTLMYNMGFGVDAKTTYAQQEEATTKAYFMEGFGTGEDFDASSWTIKNYYNNSINSTQDIYKGDEYKAKIVKNNHSGDDESIIRLVDGVELEKDVMDVGERLWDYRASAAIMTSKVRLKDEGKFSVKFTASMPDAAAFKDWCKAGGDGITFLITSSDDIEGRVGGGIGYTGIENSVAIELDSFYNTDNAANQYDPPTPDTLYDPSDSLHHVAVLVNGENTEDASGVSEKHIATSFLYKEGYTDGFTSKSDLEVEGEEVDTRLFTVWAEYDGADLYVRYAQGDFATAIRPATAQIVVDDAVDSRVKNQLELFKGKDVKVAFTSGIGDSKANHTIHSIGLVNEYFEDGIKVPYKEEYYVESPDATSDYIEVGGKKYVKDKENKVVNKDAGVPAVIKDLQGEYGSQYKLVDYSTEGYPESVNAIAQDGTTVLYQFYDINKTEYTEKYIVEVDDVESGDVVIEIDDIKYKVIESIKVTNVDVDSRAEITDRSGDSKYDDYELVEPIIGFPSIVEDVADDGSTVVYQIFRKKPSYTVNYYLEVDEGTTGAIKVGDKYYLIQVEEVLVRKGSKGVVVEYVSTDNKSAGVKEGEITINDSLKQFEEYIFSLEATVLNGKSTATLEFDEEVEIALFYDRLLPDEEDATEETGEDATEETSEDVTEETSEDATEETTSEDATEETTSEEITEESEEEITKETKEDVSDTTVQTGDNDNLILYVIALMSAVVVFVLVSKRKNLFNKN